MTATIKGFVPDGPALHSGELRIGMHLSCIINFSHAILRGCNMHSRAQYHSSGECREMYFENEEVDTDLKNLAI